MKTSLLIALITVFPGLVIAAEDADPGKAAPPAAPTSQIEIAAKFFTVPESAAERFGLTRSPGEAKGKWRNVLSAAEYERLVALASTEKSVNVLSSPRVTTRSGQRAVVEVIREFRYPTIFEEDKKAEGQLAPARFETRNTGVSLEVEPVLGPKDLIDLKLVTDVTGFDRFVTYDGGRTQKGEPIPKGKGGYSQPIFDTERNVLEATLRPGEALLLGGAQWDGSNELWDALDPGAKKLEPDPQAEPRLLFVTVTARVIKIEPPRQSAAGAGKSPGPVEVAVQVVNVASDRLPASLLANDRLPASAFANHLEATDTRAFPVEGVLAAADAAEMRQVLKKSGAEIFDAPTKLIPADGRYFVEASGLLRYAEKAEKVADGKPGAEEKSEAERMDLHLEVTPRLPNDVAVDVDTRVMLSTLAKSGADTEIESKAPPMKWKYYEGEAPHWPERAVTTSVTVFDGYTIMFARCTDGQRNHLQFLLITVKIAEEKKAAAGSN